jgi:AcrR family transcriptional regulator
VAITLIGVIGHTTDVVTTVQAEARDRRAVIADAALEVLEAEGGRGLTHRAVDRQAGLPEGSTSNYFQTREALLTAALRRVVELERPAVRAMEALVPGGPYAPAEAAELLAEHFQAWLGPEYARLAIARHELLLEARRRPQFQLALDEVHRQYLSLAEGLMPVAGCRQPRAHAPQLLAILDGLIVQNLFQPAGALGRDQIVELFERFFETC